MAHQHRGFWKPTDTVKERASLDAAYALGDRPWAVWERGGAGAGAAVGGDGAAARTA